MMFYCKFVATEMVLKDNLMIKNYKTGSCGSADALLVCMEIHSGIQCFLIKQKDGTILFLSP